MKNINLIEERIAKKIAENDAYNRDILKGVEEALSGIEIMDGNIIIKLYKITGTDFLGQRQYKAFETAGGKSSAKIEDFEYGTFGRVVLKPSKAYIETLTDETLKYRYGQLTEKETDVYLNPTLMSSGNIAFYPNRNESVHNFEGYIIVPISFIQVVKAF